MGKLQFQNAVFDEGTNQSVRRGVKWDVAEHHDVQIAATQEPDKILATVDIRTRVIQFTEIRSHDLLQEHDPACRIWDDLYRRMKQVYDDFDEAEIVTLVWFEI